MEGIIIVDHGSRRAASNEMLLEAARQFAQHSDFGIVEPAHMELAEPSIAQAYQRCVEQGATRVIVFPYFLSPGRAHLALKYLDGGIPSRLQYLL